MTRESKLYPALIQAQCQSAIAILQADNEKLLATSASVAAFVEDKEIVSVSFDQLKQQCSNYIDVINSIIEVNNMDIADYQTLSSAVGSEVLEGDVIITNQETYARLRNGAYERESIYRRKAACDMDPGLRALHYGMAEASHNVGDFYEEQYQYWLGKELLYDSIEASTSGLFTGSGAMRSALNSLLVGLSGTFHLNSGYNPSGMTVIKLQIARIKQGEIDTANGIKALEEYLIESGKYTLEERNAIINSIIDQTPERLRALPNIISVAGIEAGNVNMKEMVYSYLKDECRGFSDAEIELDIKAGLYSKEDYEYLVAIGRENPTYEGFYAVACCVRNRVYATEASYKDVVTRPGQFEGYREKNIGNPENNDIKKAAVEVLRGGKSSVGKCRYFFGRKTGEDLWCESSKCNEFYNIGNNVFYDTYGSVHNSIKVKTDDAIIIYDAESNVWNYKSGDFWKK